MGAEITSPNEARTTINSDIRAKGAWHVLAFFYKDLEQEKEVCG